MSLPSPTTSPEIATKKYYITVAWHTLFTSPSWKLIPILAIPTIMPPHNIINMFLILYTVALHIRKHPKIKKPPLFLFLITSLTLFRQHESIMYFIQALALTYVVRKLPFWSNKKTSFDVLIATDVLCSAAACFKQLAVEAGMQQSIIRLCMWYITKSFPSFTEISFLYF
jgi:hypothetical protein